MCDARVRASRVLWPNQRSALTRCPPTLDNRPRLVERSVVSRCFSDRARLYLFDRRAGAKIRDRSPPNTPAQILCEIPRPQTLAQVCKVVVLMRRSQESARNGKNDWLRRIGNVGANYFRRHIRCSCRRRFSVGWTSLFAPRFNSVHQIVTSANSFWICSSPKQVLKIICVMGIPRQRSMLR